MSSYGQQLAEWVANLAYEEIPDEVLDDAKLRILDILGVSLAASTMDVGDIVHRVALRLGSGDESEIWGFGSRTTAPSAAVANGAMAHALDYDDTHNESVIHVSAPIVSTALTLGQALGSSGRQVLAAVVAGREVTCRIGVVAPGGFHARGFHPTGVVGTLGAALTAGKLLGLDGVQLAHALGVAGSQAAGLLEFFSDGSWAKRLHAGWAAHSGITAALLAREGFSGPETILEGRFGVFNAHLGTDRDFAFGRLTGGLGTDWESLKVSYKPYPCGHVIHPFLDAVLDLRREEGLTPGEIHHVTCRIAHWMVPIVCEPWPAKIRPASDYHGKFSLPFSIAAALHFGRLGVEAYTPENIADPDILALVDKIHYDVDETVTDSKHYRGWVMVETRDGRRLERIVKDNWGSRENPMTAPQVRRKFLENAVLALPEDQADEIIRIAGRLQDVARVDDLLAPARRTQGRA